MKYLAYLHITVLLILASQFSFARPSVQGSDYYFLINNSKEDLYVTIKYKEIIIGWDILGGTHTNYSINEVIVDRIYLNDNYPNGEYYLQNHFLPNTNRYINGNFHWKYKDFFRRITPENIYRLDRNEILRIFGEEYLEPFPQNVLFEYRRLSGNEILSLFIKELLITDIQGNIIIQLNDINEYFFDENDVANYIEEYTIDLFELPGYRNRRIEENYELLYGIFITDEIIQEVRRKRLNE